MAGSIIAIATIVVFCASLIYGARTKRMGSFRALLAVTGMVGFAGDGLLRPTGNLFERVEFPPFDGSVAIAGPGGTILAVNRSLQRVQIYSAGGEFQKDWFVGGEGGRLTIGLTIDDTIVIASARGKSFEFFDLDGARGRAKMPVGNLSLDWDSPIPEGNYGNPGVWIKSSRKINHPAIGWTAWALVPFWHPLLAWLMVGAALLPEIVAKIKETWPNGRGRDR